MPFGARYYLEPGFLKAFSDLELAVKALQEAVGVNPTGAPTWDEIKVTANPLILPHRGGGADVSIDNSLSSLDFAASLGAPRRVFDGGDIWVGAGEALLINHNSRTAESMDVDVSVTAQTESTWKTLRLRNYPLYRGTISTEAPPTFPEWLNKVKALDGFCVPEDKHGLKPELIVAAINAAGMQKRVNVQSFHASRLFAARAAGMSVCLLQSAGTNLGTGVTGANAILTSINGAAPEMVGFNPTNGPGTDDAWLQTLINAGVLIQLYTLDRRKSIDDAVARVKALGGKVIFVASDNPGYAAKLIAPRTTDRFAEISALASGNEHGLITSAKSSSHPRIVSNKFSYPSSNAQWALLGAFARDSMPTAIRFKVTWDALDTTTSRWIGIGFGCPDDRSFHDGNSSSGSDSNGVQTGMVGYMAFARQSGGINLGKHTADPQAYTALAAEATGSPAITAAGAVETYEVGINGTGQPYFTRIGTDGVARTITSTNADTQFRGGYWHVGKFGSAGQKFSISDIVITV